MNATVEEPVSGSLKKFPQLQMISQPFLRKGSDGIQDIAASAEEQLASMEEISSSALTLERMSEELRDLTKQFKVDK